MGVGGYLLGGGVNVIGTSQRLTSGASNVLQYTMVDAKGDIYKVLVKIEDSFFVIILYDFVLVKFQYIF